jgi:heptosyltransferase-2
VLEPPAGALAWADRWLAAAPGRRPGLAIVALEPGGAYGVAKRWGEDRYAELARRLVTSGTADVVLVGTADAAPLHDRIATRAGDAGGRLVKAAGVTDLSQLAGLLASASLLVTNDTGPMHLAAAVGTPVLALFGSTDPAVCGPRGAGEIRVLYERVACSPCYLKECPVEGHPCLDRFEVGRVEAVARDMLERARARS